MGWSNNPDPLWLFLAELEDFSMSGKMIMPHSNSSKHDFISLYLKHFLLHVLSSRCTVDVSFFGFSVNEV